MKAFDEALKTAREYCKEHGGSTVTQAFDLSDCWVFFSRKDGVVGIGGGALAVDKETGAASPFAPTAGGNLARVQRAQQIDIEDGVS